MAASTEVNKFFIFTWFSAVSFIVCSCYYSFDGDLYMKILHPKDISYIYPIRPARIGGIFENHFDHIHLVPTIPADACSIVENVADLHQQIALVKRGGCSFLSKTINVDGSGAVAVIIYDNHSTNDWFLVDMIGDETERDTELPTAFMQGRDGQRIVDSLSRHGEKSAVLTFPYNITAIPFGAVRKPPWSLW